MSLIFQNIASGNMQSGNTSAAGSKQAAGASEAAGAFNQSLTQMMAGEATQPNGTALIGAGTLLEGLLKLAGANAAGEDENADGQNIADLLQSLVAEPDKLDEAIAADPELLAALQGWLGQIQILLNQANPVDDGTLAADEHAWTGPLAENPATIRFVVQDGLAQLASMLKEPQGNSQVQMQAAQLIQSFQDIMIEALPVQPKQASAQTNAASVPNHAAGSAAAQIDTKDMDKLLNLMRQPQDSNGAKIQTVPAVLAKIGGSDQALNSWLKGEMSPGQEQAAVADNQEHASDLFDSQNTVTAGQLVLRQGINASVKTASTPAQVPVENFSQEMSGFVVNKLEFVKQHGVSEARITLYPERLGQVDIKLTMQNGQLVAQFTTEHAATRDLLEQQMSQLRSSLQTQGVQVEKLVVTQNPSPQSQMYHDGRQPGSGQQQSNRRSKEKDAPTDDALKVAELGEELKEWLAEQEQTDGGNTFTAKA
ncbi:flagellar hook-length control protein FliK [Paenibacillus azoreducens]|uniref:flagellar hook-length control protein FliK n=1 Tax=Paenibacillus azoreducens TaxID=116718 RepID=UPI0039F4AEE8